MHTYEYIHTYMHTSTHMHTCIQVPADLQLHYGYFAVKMRGPSEAGLTVLQGFGAESTYFAGHPIYGRASAACKERIGVPAMTRFLSKVLLQQLKRHMPEILKEVNILHAATERKLRDHGLAVPNDESDRTVLIQVSKTSLYLLPYSLTHLLT